MKKNKQVLILTVLMVLYIGSAFLAPYYGQSATPTQPNMIKDFTPAAKWYQEFAYRKLIRIYGSIDAGADYQVRVNVTYESAMQPDFDDIAFSDNDNVTWLDFWIEEYVASSYALVWVEVADDLVSDLWLMMYYGNPTASSGSDGDATFLFYEDWTSESIAPAKWDTITSDGSISFDDTGATHGSILKLEGSAGSNVYELRTDLSVSAPISIIARINLELPVAADQRTIWGMSSTADAPMALVRSIDGTDHSFLVFDDDVNSDDTPISVDYFGQFNRFMITRSGSVGHLYNSTSNTLIASGDMQPDSVSRAMINLYVRDSEKDLYCDWTLGRKFVAIEPELAFWGPEEPNPYVASWDVINDSVPFIFSVSFDEWGMNVLLIILGLVMIPTSGLYLAYGVRHDRSSDRLFYGLIIFLLGCGLFIGGIMP